MPWRSVPRAAAVIVVAAATSAWAAGVTDGSSVTPVEKVIQMLTNMATRAKGEKNAEAVEYAKFDQFCEGTIASKEKEIAAAAALIESLTAESAKLDSDAQTLGTAIGDLENGITANKAELEKVAARREKEHSDYQEQIQDLTECVDALERATATLQKQNYDRPATATEALLQLSQSPAMPERVRRTIAVLMEAQGPDDFLNRHAPEAAAYEFQSGSIIDVLKKLRDDFVQKKGEAEKENMNSEHAAQMMSQDLHDQIEGATGDISDKTQLREEKKAISAETKKRLAATVTDHDEATVYLKDLRVEHEEKGRSFKEKQELRADEIEAVEKAIEILSSPDVAGAAKEHLPASAAGASALAQVRSSGGQPQPALAPGVRRTLAVFLGQRGQRIRSARLGILAQKIASSSDPFTKVKRLIEEMIKQLLREAGEESEHKGWCDTELGTNKNTRRRLQEDIDGLTARIDEGEATVVEGSRRMDQLAQEVSELQAAMREALELRGSEKAKNEATVQDAKAAQSAVRAAAAILEDFYKKAATATALLQGPVKMGSPEWNSLANPSAAPLDQGHREGMQTFGETYTGSSDEAGGVLAMLEVIRSDFARLEADTAAAEQAAADEHQGFVAESRKSVAVKEKESSMLKADVAATEADLATARKDLAASQDQLLAADREFETLKPQCLDLGVSFEEREKARREEIESLQEALRILGGEELSS